MVISFEEKGRAVIEARDMTIIEFKQRMYKLDGIIRNVYDVIKDIVDKIEKAMKSFADGILGAVDNVKLLIDEIREVYNYSTSWIYRVVKVFSKCTGIEKLEMWKMTRHTWLARSCC